MFIAQSQFVVANGMEEQVRRAFIDRPRLVDQAPGFVRMEVLNPLDAPAEFWLFTYWTDKASWEAWYRSHSYHNSHQGIPKGLKLDPSGTRIRYFERLTE